MFLLKSLIGTPGHCAARPGCVRGRSSGKQRLPPLLLERLENRLCLSMWSEPVNLGPVVNSQYDEGPMALSPDGLSLYFTSFRPGHSGVISISRRASLTDPWTPPQDLGPTINYPGKISIAPSFSLDGHRLFFDSNRPGAYGDLDVYVSYRDDTNDDFGWQSPVNLGPGVNSPYYQWGSTYFEDAGTGITTLYFARSSNHSFPNVGQPYDIYASTLQSDGSFGPAVLVPELSSAYFDGLTAIRSDGLQMFLVSDRPGGPRDSPYSIWVSTRTTTLDPWSTPVNLGAPINIAGFNTGVPALSSDGNTLIFYSTNRPGGYGGDDLYISTRLPLVADHFTLTSPANTTAGQTMSVTLTAWDHYGNIATAYAGSVTFASSDPRATLPASYTFTADDNGAHTFDFVLRTAGAQSIKVADSVGEVIGARTGIVVNPAAADHFLITAASTAVSGTPFDVTITALDPYANIDTNYQATVIFSTTDPDSGVVLSVDYTFTTGDGGDNGVHNFAGGVILVTLGDQTLTITDTVSGVTGSTTITVGPGP
jgi:hypothetical protein